MGFWSKETKAKVRVTAKLRRIGVLTKLADDDLKDTCDVRAEWLQEALAAAKEKGIKFTISSEGDVFFAELDTMKL